MVDGKKIVYQIQSFSSTPAKKEDAGFFGMEKFLTKGQIEDSLSKEVTKFYFKTLGVGPKESRVYILEDMVIIRLKGKLLPIEEKLLEGKDGVSMVKNIRKTLHELLTKNLRNLIEDITKHEVISSHSDVSTRTGEILEVFILETNYEKKLSK